MPIYEYKCEDCGKTDEFLIGVTEKDEPVKCRKCGSSNLKKVFSAPFGVSKSFSENFSTSECCGMTNPCENPKRCCGR